MSLILREKDKEQQVARYEENIPYDQQLGPVAAFPANPYDVRLHKKAEKQEIVMTDQVFKDMERSYMTKGYTVDPKFLESDNPALIGDLEKAKEHNGLLSSESSKPLFKKRKRMEKGKVDDLDWKGPWAGYEGENDHLTLNQVDEAHLARVDIEKIESVVMQSGGPSRPITEKSVFHGPSEVDYLGRSWMHAPTDVSYTIPDECSIPKKCIHTFQGHKKGVNRIKYFPKTAHMLLSCSMDNTVKLWDLHNDRLLMRDYMGHAKAVRDVCFNNDGKQFLSASYDRSVKLWDTETGQCVSRFVFDKPVYCVVFHPEIPNVFLCGSADKKIYQYDTRTNQLTQEYDQHLGAVNTITFIDQNRKFVSTSDDKTMRVWEYDIPVVVKYIAEPGMHSTPAVCYSPSRKWLSFTSLDNRILTYGAEDKFYLNRRRIFRGHMVAGYACQPSYSPDERLLCSGDSSGKVYFWDTETCRITDRFKAHDSVVMSAEWHPFEASKIATCSWDSTIKLWI